MFHFNQKEKDGMIHDGGGEIPPLPPKRKSSIQTRAFWEVSLLTDRGISSWESIQIMMSPAAV